MSTDCSIKEVLGFYMSPRYVTKVQPINFRMVQHQDYQTTDLNNRKPEDKWDAWGSHDYFPAESPYEEKQKKPAIDQEADKECPKDTPEEGKPRDTPEKQFGPIRLKFTRTLIPTGAREHWRNGPAFKDGTDVCSFEVLLDCHKCLKFKDVNNDAEREALLGKGNEGKCQESLTDMLFTPGERGK